MEDSKFHLQWKLRAFMIGGILSRKSISSKSTPTENMLCKNYFARHCDAIAVEALWFQGEWNCFKKDFPFKKSVEQEQ